jgi:hypothetical protein
MKPLVQIDREELNKVSDLIDYENWMWKIELIRINFTAPEADAIFNIPLHRDGGDDMWAWGSGENMYLL